MDQLHQFKMKLQLLETLLGKMKSPTSRVRELKKSVNVLKIILKNKENIRSPYGPKTAIVRFSIH